MSDCRPDDDPATTSFLNCQYTESLHISWWQKIANMCSVKWRGSFLNSHHNTECGLWAHGREKQPFIKADFAPHPPPNPKWSFCCCLSCRDVIFGAISGDRLLTHHNRSSERGLWVIGRKKVGSTGHLSYSVAFDRGEEKEKRRDERRSKFCTAGSSI